VPQLVALGPQVLPVGLVDRDLYRDPLGDAQPESPLEHRLVYALGLYIVGLMMSCALVDAAGILGFVLTLLLHDLVHVVRLGALSVIVLVLFHRPSRTAMEDMSSEVKRTVW